MQNPYFFFDNPLIVNELMKQGIDVEKLKAEYPSLNKILSDGLQELVDNGTITELLEDIVPTSNDILLIGDSYTSRNHYQQYLEPFFDNIYTYAQNGAGLGYYNDGKSFKECVTQAMTELSEQQKNNIRHVVIYGGYNDISHSADVGVCSANLEYMLNTLNTNLPNALIHLIPMNMRKNHSWAHPQFPTYVNIWVNATYNNPRAIVHEGAQGWLKSDIGLYDSDNLHPSIPAGYKVIAQNIIQCIYGAGQTNYKTFNIDINHPNITGRLTFYVKNGIMYIDREQINLSFDEQPAGDAVDITTSFPVYYGFTTYIQLYYTNQNAGWLSIKENTLTIHFTSGYKDKSVFTEPTCSVIGF